VEQDWSEGYLSAKDFTGYFITKVFENPITFHGHHVTELTILGHVPTVPYHQTPQPLSDLSSAQLPAQW
jgi:hypothetical protein